MKEAIENTHKVFHNVALPQTHASRELEILNEAEHASRTPSSIFETRAVAVVEWVWLLWAWLIFLGRGLNKPHSQAKEKIMVTRRAILVFLVVLVCFFAAVYSQNISKKHRD